MDISWDESSIYSWSSKSDFTFGGSLSGTTPMIKPSVNGANDPSIALVDARGRAIANIEFKQKLTASTPDDANANASKRSDGIFVDVPPRKFSAHGTDDSRDANRNTFIYSFIRYANPAPCIHLFINLFIHFQRVNE